MSVIQCAAAAMRRWCARWHRGRASSTMMRWRHDNVRSFRHATCQQTPFGIVMLLTHPRHYTTPMMRSTRNRACAHCR